MITPGAVSGTVEQVQHMVLDPVSGPAGTYHYELYPEVVVINPQNTAEQFALSLRLIRFSINASIDNPSATADITFATGEGEFSLSPLIDGSSFHFATGGRAALSPGTQVVLRMLVTGQSASGTYQLFWGRIDRVSVEANGDEVRIQCRDSAGVYLNKVIQTDAHYGSAGGTAAHTVMNSICTDNGLPAVELRAPAFDAPTWMIYDYAQEPMPVLEALRRIVQQFGWDVRSFPSGGFPVVTLYDPNRERSDFDVVIGSERYESIDELSWGDEDVRNIWDVYWQDADGTPQTPERAEDTTSIDQYGERYARIFLNRAENIRDAASASDFAFFALADTREPFASHVIRAPLLPMVELNDVHQYLANSIHYDTDLTFAIVSYRHDYEAGHGTTTLGARGRPIGAYRDYRRSVPPKAIVALTAPDDAIYAPEGTFWMQTPDLTFPA